MSDNLFGNYWTNSLNSSNSSNGWYLNFSSGKCSISEDGGRFSGFSVRGVLPTQYVKTPKYLKRTEIIDTIPETLAYDAKANDNNEGYYTLYSSPTSVNGPDGYQYYKYTWTRSELTTLFPLNATYKVNIDGKEYNNIKFQFKTGRMYLSNGIMSDIVQNYMVEPKIGEFFIAFYVSGPYY